MAGCPLSGLGMAYLVHIYWCIEDTTSMRWAESFGQACMSGVAPPTIAAL